MHNSELLIWSTTRSYVLYLRKFYFSLVSTLINCFMKNYSRHKYMLGGEEYIKRIIIKNRKKKKKHLMSFSYCIMLSHCGHCHLSHFSSVNPVNLQLITKTINIVIIIVGFIQYFRSKRRFTKALSIWHKIYNWPQGPLKGGREGKRQKHCLEYLITDDSISCQCCVSCLSPILLWRLKVRVCLSSSAPVMAYVIYRGNGQAQQSACQ